MFSCACVSLNQELLSSQRVPRASLLAFMESGWASSITVDQERCGWSSRSKLRKMDVCQQNWTFRKKPRWTFRSVAS